MTNKRTVKCPVHNTDMLIKNCLARQKIIAEKPTGDSAQALAYPIYLKSCGTCEMGKNLYQKEIKKTMKEKTQEEQPESKTCPCGKVFYKKPETNIHTWRNMKYCPEHSAMTPYKRAQAFEKIKNEKHGAPFKSCENPDCEKKFFKPEGVSASSWAGRRYCSDECAKEIERQKESIRKKKQRQKLAEAKQFDENSAEAIAAIVTAERLERLSPFIVDSRQYDQIKSVAMEVCVEAQRLAHKRFWRKK